MSFKEVNMCLLRVRNQNDEYGVFEEYDHGYAIPEWSGYRPRSNDLRGATVVGIADGQRFEGNNEGADVEIIEVDR